jgi:filamentous hemagglutinin family protein
MNQGRHRLVFDRRRGMHVPAAEHARSTRKAASAMGVLSVVAAAAAHAAAPIPSAASLGPRLALPVRSSDAARLAGDAGQFSVSTPNASNLVVNQTSAKAVINWDSFDIGAGSTVKFVQPDKGSALNRIWDANPSLIQGRLQANGEVILQNSNGLILSPTARVETGRLVATALLVLQDAFQRGLRGATDGSPSLQGLDGQNQGFVSLERGAEVVAAAGGDVLIFAPRVVNNGRIETPGGQTVLGAGQTVYLAASADPAQRGLIVGIKPWGGTDAELNTVTQGASLAYQTVDGQTVPDSTAAGTAGLVSKVNGIFADSGSINLVGLALRQNGLLQATTAVKGQNGVILLQAQADVTPLGQQTVGSRSVNVPQATALGTVTLGASSVTRITPAADTQATQLDSETFAPSHIRVEGRAVVVQGGAQVLAPSGNIELLASDNPQTSLAFNPGSPVPVSSTDSSRIVVGSGAVISAAGLRDFSLPMSRNQLSGRLFQIELAGSPVQRSGPLYREAVYFDARNPPTLADVSGFYATVARTAQEHSTQGGTVALRSDGAVAVDAGARIDVSGGSVRYEDGTLLTSLLRQGSSWVPVDQASAAVRYDELGNSQARTDAGNAVFKVQNVAGYVQGSAAGVATVSGRLVSLAGTLEGGVVIGPRQSGRGPDALPQSGTLVIGSTQGRASDSPLPGLSVQDTAASSGSHAARPDALFADPVGTAIDGLLSPTLTLDAGQITGHGIGHLQAYVQGRFSLAAGTTLALGAGGGLNVVASQADLGGSVLAPGGTVAVSTTLGGLAATHDLTLGAQALIDVSGNWTDELRQAAPDPTRLVAIHGGKVSLTAAGSLASAAGARVDVSAGARRASGGLVQGKAGAISLALNAGAAATQPLPGSFAGWQGALAGFDFAAGGKLSISGLPGLTLDAAGLRNGPFGNALFNGSGFGQISLRSLGDVTVASDFRLDLQLSNFVPSQAIGGTVGDGSLAGVGPLPLAAQRAPVSLSLQGSLLASPKDGIAGSSVVVQAGARMATEAGGSLALAAGRNLTVAGSLLAPGGSITLSVNGTRGGSVVGGTYDDAVGFLADQALWLTPTASLSVAGTPRLRTDRLGRPVGDVLGGGTVTLDAERGYVVAEAGSQIDLRGAAAVVLTAADTVPQTVSRSAGTLNVHSPEGVYLGATLRATAADSNADGGALNVSLGLNGQDRQTSGTIYATTGRELHLADSASAAAVDQPGQSVAAWLGNGTGQLAVPALAAAGFAQIHLQADDRIVFDSTLNLTAARSITLDARVLSAAPLKEVGLQAPYVALGDQRRTAPAPFETAATATAGDAVLQVRAGLIDVFGRTALQGFKFAGLDATLDTAGGLTRSDGEVRLVGTVRGDANRPTGSLGFSGEFQVMGGQLYATTLSQFDITGTGSRSVFGSYQPLGGSSSVSPLSALAALTVNASRIDLYGVIRQPDGSLAFNADQLTVNAGSELSVNLGATPVPVGTTVNGRQWQYNASGLYAADGSARAVDATANPAILALDAQPVAKGLALNGKTVNIAAGATLSAQGGGSLQAWEFVAGVGGATDTLARAGFYAVLPNRRYDFAPSDAEVLASTGAAAPQPGGQIDITLPGSALAPGRYTLLPARYALLPGAVLVSLAPDPGKSPLAAAQFNDDGSAVVTGDFSAVGSHLKQPQRILVEPAATVLARSRLDVTDIAGLLTGNAQRVDATVPALPGDAGRVTLLAQQALTLGSAVALQGIGSAPGGSLDVAVAGGRLAVVDAISAPPAGVDAGWTLLDAGVLSGGGAGSLLVGGTRSADGLTLTAQSSTVALLGTTQALAAGEVMLLGRDAVQVGAGAALQAVGGGSSGGGARTLTLAGDGAYALVSASDGVNVARSGAPGVSGILTLGAKVGLSGASVQLGGSQDLALASDAKVSAQTLGLSARRLAIGAPTAVEAGTTVLDGDLLSSLAATRSLSLTSSSRIDFSGSRTLAFDSLTLDAPTLLGLDGANVQLTAQALTLRNSSGHDGDATLVGQGQLLLKAGSGATGGGGRFVVGQSGVGGTPVSQFLGFTQATLSSGSDLVFSGSGRLVAQGDLTLSAARVTASTGADQGAAAPAGLLRVTAPAGASTPAGPAAGQGAQLQFSGRTLEQLGNVQAPGGQVTLAASGVAGQTSLRLGEGSITSAAGFATAATPDWTLYGDAGQVNLRADSGWVQIEGRIDVSAPGTARGGSVTLSAPGGAAESAPAQVTLTRTAVLAGGSAGGGAGQGSRLRIDTGRLSVAGSAGGDLDALAALLAGAGFDAGLTVRARSGDLFSATQTLRADQVNLSADQGSVVIAGRIDARTPSGGSVMLQGGVDVRLTGTIDASASSAALTASGGDVLLAAGSGRVVLGRTARIAASGGDAESGRVVLRAGRDDSAGTLRIAVADGFDSAAQLSAGEIDLEAVRTYTGATSLGAGNSSGSRLGQATLLSDLQAWSERSAGVLRSLGLAGDARVLLRGGIDVVTSGDFTLGTDWNLWQAQRPGGAPGFLTLRAAGNLVLTGSLSDGFESAARLTGGAPTQVQDGPAWSYRLVAGADLGAADVLAVGPSSTAGDLRIANDRLVRTTAGSIAMAAARDIVLYDKSSVGGQAVVYVAGRPDARNGQLQLNDSSAVPQFTSHGGGLQLTAGRDITGAPAAQLFGAWFYQTGTPDNTAVAWWSAFDAFRMGVGSFGGGAVQVSAGRDVSNLGVVAPTAGLAAAPVDSSAGGAAVPVVGGGGDIRVSAGRDILGGTYFLGHGQGLLQAGGRIAEGDAAAAARVSAIAPVLGLMDGSWTLRARGDLAWAAVFNSTMLPSANAPSAGQQRIGDSDGGLFFSYGSGSAFSAASLAGQVLWQGERPAGQTGMSGYWSGLAANGPAAERMVWDGKYANPTGWAPPRVDVAAFGGDLDLTLATAGLTLYPSPAGSLSLFADGRLRLLSHSVPAALTVSDQNPASLPGVQAPISALKSSDDFPSTRFAGTTSLVNVAWSGLARTDRDAVRIAAGGDIDFSQARSGATAVLVSPKGTEISAGGDIRNLSFYGQHANAGDVSSISAQGSLVQGAGAAGNRISLGGPGELRVSAGRQLDLGASYGIETVGNQYLSTLPAQGASVTVAAGLRPSLNLDAFSARYLTAAAGTTPLASQAAALADGWLAATGKDPAQLSAADQVLRAQLVARYASVLALTGADATALPQRRSLWVALASAALGLPVPAEADRAAAFDSVQAAFKGLPAAQQAAVAEQFLTQQFAQAYLAPSAPYAAAWQAAAAQAGVPAAQYSGPVFERLRLQVLFGEFNLAGGWASQVPASAAAVRQATYGVGFAAADLAGLGGVGGSLSFAGDLDMVASGVRATSGGNITLLAPGGQINVGLPGTGGSSLNPTAPRGVVSYGAGDISAYADGNFQVNSQRVFVVGQGDIAIWSSKGNIDAGRGANTAVSIPPLVPVRQGDGSIAFALPSVTVGSGIGILQPAVGQAAGNIGLYAPNGEVLALDAQIRAPGRITLAAEVVRGADNISGGSVVGAPAPLVVATPQIPTERGNAAEAQGALAAAGNSAAAASAARERSSLLLVELLGLGNVAGTPDDSDSNSDEACRRQQEKDRREGRSATACPRGVGPGRE